MSPADRILSRRDLDFLLYEWLRADRLVARERFSEHSRETFDAAIDLASRLATEHFAPINRLLDTQEPTFDGENVHTPAELKTALRAFCDAGLMSAGFDFEWGGMQLPHVIERACFAWFNGANIAASGYPLLTMGNANLLVAHGSPEQVQTWVPHLLSGRFFGTMCLSEPQAGSSLSDIRTRAEPQGDGSWRLFGNKMWISGGEQDLTENIVHLVLAKAPNAEGVQLPGVRGISLFLVPKRLLDAQGRSSERNDVVLAGLNHKMGHRGTTNTLLNFGEGKFRPGGAPGAVGWMVGEPGQGLACMFHMMNEARIGVGMGAVMLGYTAWRHALDYARQRPQGRLPQNKDPQAAQVPIVAHADVRRMLLAAKAYSEGGLGLNLYCASLVDEQKTAPDAQARADAHDLLELLTPVAKSWPSQWGQEANSLAIQVHGGYGYTRDYPVEQFYRDQRLNPIHEGTHGIQGLDLLGRKVRLQDGRALELFAARVSSTVTQASSLGAEWTSAASALAARGARIVEVVRILHAAGDLNRTLANSSVFLEAFGHWVVAWVWLEQACVALSALASAEGSDQAFYRGKLQAARYFFRWELPRIDPMLELLASLDTTTLDMQDAWF